MAQHIRCLFVRALCSQAQGVNGVASALLLRVVGLEDHASGCRQWHACGATKNLMTSPLQACLHTHEGSVDLQYQAHQSFDFSSQYVSKPSPVVMTSWKLPPPGIMGSTCWMWGTMMSSRKGPSMANISCKARPGDQQVPSVMMTLSRYSLSTACTLLHYSRKQELARQKSFM